VGGEKAVDCVNFFSQASTLTSKFFRNPCLSKILALAIHTIDMYFAIYRGQTKFVGAVYPAQVLPILTVRLSTSITIALGEDTRHYFNNSPLL